MRYPLLVLALFLSATMATWQPVDTTLIAAMQEKKDEPKFDPATKGKGYRPSTPEVKAQLHAQAWRMHGNRMAVQAQNATPPAQFDCRTQGWVPLMLDQGSCGSCYLVSTMGTNTSSWIKSGYGKNDGSFKISDQWGMDCHNFGGCNGGNGTEVIAYVVANGSPAEKWVDQGGQSHSDYPPYIARSSSCRTAQGAKMWKPQSWGFCTGDQSGRRATVLEIKSAMMQYGVLNIALDAGGAFGNTDGVTVIETLGQNIDHEIQMVGWDDSKGKNGAWLVMNQWGTGWGNKGFAWIGYNAYLVDHFWVSAAPVIPPPANLVVTIPPIQAQVGQPVTFSATATGGTSQYTWAFDYGDGSKGTQPTHTWTAAGSYTVTASVEDTLGAKGIGAAVATVGSGPGPGPGPSGAVVKVTLDYADGGQQVFNANVLPSTTVRELADKAASSATVPAKGPAASDVERLLGIVEKLAARIERLEKQLAPMKP